MWTEGFGVLITFNFLNDSILQSDDEEKKQDTSGEVYDDEQHHHIRLPSNNNSLYYTKKQLLVAVAIVGIVCAVVGGTIGYFATIGGTKSVVEEDGEHSRCKARNLLHSLST